MPIDATMQHLVIDCTDPERFATLWSEPRVMADPEGNEFCLVHLRGG